MFARFASKWQQAAGDFQSLAGQAGMYLGYLWLGSL